MIKTTAMLLDELKNYASPKTKLSRMVKNGELFRVTKGIYETDKGVSAHLLAGSIYGPSYISFEYALSYYGMIPEAVYTVTSATYEKKKKKKYETPFGVFVYQDIPAEAYPFYLEVRREGDYWYRIASPEKAVCDQLYTLPPVKNRSELAYVLFNDMRMDEEEICRLNKDVVRELSAKYHSANVRIFSSLLRRF
ncbi:MAG: hypothetical protein IJM62_01265 [Lachnospiraceae bacterium]|nr:hypothetical protein [Lachnospiraceae bacterium]